MIKSSLEDYYAMRYVSSPDHHAASGRVAYTLSQPLACEYEQRIVIRDLKSGEEHNVTAGGKREEFPRFSPDGRSLAFLSNASGEVQIWLADLADGSVRQLTRLGEGVSNHVWSPDGTRLAFLSSSLPDQSVDQRSGESAVIIEDYGFKSDEAMGFAPKTASHLWVAPVNGEPARRLTDGDRDHVMPVWSPDGEWLVFTSNRCRAREESIGMDLFKAPSAGGEITRLTDSLWVAYYPKPFQPLFTPDGRSIIIGALEPSLSGGLPPTRLYRLPADGGEAVSIWPQNAPCYEATCFLYNAENYGSFPQTAQVSEDGRFIYFLSGWAGACNIYRANVSGEPEITAVTTGQHCYRNLCPPAGGRMLAAKGDFTMTPQLELLDPASGESTRLTDSNPWIRSRSLSQAQELWVDTLDGRGRVHGFAIPPQQMLEGEKYPTILYIHGGPTPFYGYALTYEYQVLAAAGFGVLLCNPRGCGGYGEKHGAMAQATDGTAMYDLLQFTDEAARTFPWIDSARLGVTGGSYGGYMTNWLASHSRRYKAAVTQRSVASNLIAYASGDMAGSSREYKDFTDFMKAELKKSPVAYADCIDIPFLILHSLGDMRCPVEHAHQLYTAVKDTHPDLPVRLVLFPDSNHSLTMEGPMQLRIAHYHETIDWFAKYL